MRPSSIVSFFGFMLTFGVGIMYYLLRFKFADNSVDIPLRVVGAGAFIMFLPDAFAFIEKYFSDAVRKTFFNDTVVSIYGLILFCLIGYSGRSSALNFSYPFILAGYVLLVLNVIRWLKTIQYTHFFVFLLASGFLSVWIGSLCWYMVLKPFILEGWAVGTDKIDTHFHLAIAQMIKTYGIPSTGLDGVPFMNYHWGSHWMFAQLSNFLKVPVIVIYQLVFPAIVAPLLCKTFVSLAVQIQSYLKPQSGKQELNFFFWLVCLIIFVGFVKNAAAGNTVSDYFSGSISTTLFIFLSESYTVSLLLMFGIMASALHFWRNREQLTIIHQCVFLFAVVPLWFTLIGISKISTLFVLCCLTGYLFLRLKMFTKILYWLWMTALVVTAVVVYSFIFETRENHGTQSWFHYYKNFNLSIPLFLLLFYLWTYILIVAFIISEGLYKLPFKQWIVTNRTIALECAIVVAVAGFLPTAVLRIQNYDALYFTDIQTWVSGAILLACVPFYKVDFHWSRRLKLLLAVPAIYLVAIFYFNTKVYALTILGDSLNTHKRLFYGNTEDRAISYRKLPAELVYLSKGTYEPDNKVLHFLLKLHELDSLPLEEKARTFVYVNFRKLFKAPGYKWGLQCHNAPFIVPALSGMASIDGIDITYFDCVGGSCCEHIGMSYHYYTKWKTREEIERGPTVQELLSRTEKAGYRDVIIFNIETEKFERITGHKASSGI